MELEKLESLILNYYLKKGYKIGEGKWGFKIQIDTDYKSKQITVWFYEDSYFNSVFHSQKTTVKEMFNEAMSHFNTGEE